MKKQLVFIDECGDPGFKSNSSPNFAFAMVIFNSSDDATKTEELIKSAELKSKNKPEFKFSKTSRSVKEIFFNTVSEAPFYAKVLYVNKLLIEQPALRKEPKKFYNYFLKQLITHADIQDAIIKLDGDHNATKKELASYLRSQTKHVIKKIQLEDSKRNSLIQLADMVVGLVCHANSPSVTDDQKRWMHMLRKKIDVWRFK